MKMLQKNGNGWKINPFLETDSRRKLEKECFKHPSEGAKVLVLRGQTARVRVLKSSPVLTEIKMFKTTGVKQLLLNQLSV